jgi:glycosyltransferase involved in cell wall biosynthesis
MKLEVTDLMPQTNRVLIITGDPIGKRLAGPAIRAWNMATELSKKHEVTLLSLTSVETLESIFDIVHVAPGDEASFAVFEDWADAIIFQGHALLVFETLQRSRKVMVVDVYDPMHLEQLEQARELPLAQWSKQVQEATTVLNDQLRRGDFFLCASERQRLFWLGQLAALGRINPQNYEQDPDLLGLIDIAPFGLSRVDPQHTRDAIKGVHPGIGIDDKLILWSGGLYNWFDPHTLIEAVSVLAQRKPNVKLFFQGTKHPHPGVPEMEIVRTSRELAADLGVLDTHVFFNDSWVDYEDRQNYLLEADLGTSTHHSHIETTFSFRTRILDYLWAELPMVVTEGDHFGDLVVQEQLGIAVKAGDVQQLAQALESALFDEALRKKFKANLKKVRQMYFWDVVLEPLLAFIDDLHFAGDHQHIPGSGLTEAELPSFHARPSRLKTILHVSKRTLREQGFVGLVKKIATKVTRRISS